MHVGFVTEKVALGGTFLQVLGSFPSQYNSPIALSYSVLLSPTPQYVMLRSNSIVKHGTVRQPGISFVKIRQKFWKWPAARARAVLHRNRKPTADSQRRHYLSGHSYNHFPSAQLSHKCVINDIFSILFCNLPNFTFLFKYSVSHLLGSSVGRSNLVKRSSVQWGWTPAYYLPYFDHFVCEFYSP